MTQHQYKVVVIASLTGVILFSFNNCGVVDFENLPLNAKSSVPIGDETDFDDVIAPGEIVEPDIVTPGIVAPEEIVEPEEVVISEDSIDEIIATLPPEVIENPQPITDLIDNPDLYDVYRCPDSSGIVICHIPKNVHARQTQCVGRSAASRHLGHIRVYAVGAEVQSIQDYLGPCRAAL